MVVILKILMITLISLNFLTLSTDKIKKIEFVTLCLEFSYVFFATTYLFFMAEGDVFTVIVLTFLIIMCLIRFGSSSIL